MSISQERLAETLGVTFQQLQKYEKAANRVSASRLFEIAAALDVEPSYFFLGLGGDSGDPVSTVVDPAYELFLTPDGQELARHFPKVKARARRKILELVRALLAAEADEDRTYGTS